MKQYKVNVNGKVYEITLEETTMGSAPVAVSQSASAQVAKSVAQSTPVVAGNGEKVLAPMPGTVLKIKAASGSAIKKGQPIVILEAMKMENEITATVDGTVTVCVAEGAKINSGDIIATIA